MKKVCHKYLEFVNGLFLNPGRSLKTAALLLAAGFAVAACRVDEQFEEQEDGLPAAVSVRLSLPDMTVQTRSLTDNQASAVNHIWLGIYDAASGRLKGSFEKAVSHEDRHVLHQLDNIISSSGNSYIVAVANARDNYGMSSGIEGVATDASGRANLLDLLHNADTWDKYRSIAVALQNTSVVEYTEANVVMTGSYTSKSNTDLDKDHPLGPDVESVYLKGGNNNLPGRIHLRRVISQVTFNITAGTGITIRPTSWRVVNNPRLSFLQERQDNSKDNNGKDVTNAGDVITAHLDDAAPNANYGASHPETEIAGSSTAGYSFSFYTYENKRTGTAADYDAREKEHKLDDGSNTGIYVALCGESTESPNVKNGVNLNNFATYVEIKCEVNYTYDEHPRTGTAVYTVHLGYVDGAGDFNVRRNYKYTYNMQVLGLNQIVIEAEKEEGEPHPGIEGDVIDATQSIVTVDAHYGVYNIQLSNVERARLHYYMEAPYGGEVKVVEGGYPKGGGNRLPTPDKTNPYYNWIRIKPTSGEKIFAEYKSSTTDEPWYLDDLVGVDANHRGYGDNTGSLTDNTQRWYTVFINEYVYEGTYDGVEHGLSDWVNFVNQDMRTVLFLVQDIAVSDDTESRYSQGKYLLRQRSIQTYYSTDPAVMGEKPTALGAEHINESYGKNIDWRWTATTSSPDGTPQASTVLSNRNGRWNLWKFLNNSTNTNNNNGLSNSEASRNWWCNYTDLTADNVSNAYGLIRYVNNRGTNVSTRSGYIRTDEEGYAVPALAYCNSASTNNRQQDPQQGVSRYYEASALCMSRNRDLDGDGQISPDELRWYLPAEGKYERIMLGRNSLVTPIFSVSNGLYYTNPNDDIAVKNNNWGFDGDIGTGNDNEVQYISSDHMKFFPEEGGSYNRNIFIHWGGGYSNNNHSGGRVPWNIRCVRNLGVKLETVTQNPNDDPVEKAYSYDRNNLVFDMTHYYGNSLRASIDTYLEVHNLLDLDKNKTPKKLKVSQNSVSYDLSSFSDKRQAVIDALNANIPCANYSENGDEGKTWRAPNQRELMMMLNEGVISSKVFSCTMEGYGAKTRFAVSSGSIMKMLDPSGQDWDDGGKITTVLTVRCVRDIE